MGADVSGVNATGVGDQNLRSDDGGNNTGRGVLGQTRPTGIMATGGGGSAMSEGMGMSSGEGRAAKRKPSGRSGRR